MLVNGVLPLNEKVNFKGSQKSKDSHGYETYEFFLPHDKEKYEVKVEIAPVIKENSNWFVDEKSKIEEFQIKPDEKFVFDPSKTFLPNQDFAYRFKIFNKATKEVTYHQDNGVRIDKYGDKKDPKFVIIHRDRIPGKMSGVMGHALADNFNPGYKMENGKPVSVSGLRETMIDIQRNHFNLYGGNIAGIIEKIPYLQEMGFDRILFTPFGDDRSNHGYWTKNGYQITDRVGNIEDYKKLNVELAKKGMSLVADGAFVNEGLEGIHFRYNLKWGEQSPFNNWIKGHGYKTIGILPSVDATTKEGKELFSHLKIKVTNGDYKYTYAQDGSLIKTANKRDKTQRTFFQVYDDRLVSKELLAKDEVLPKSDILETNNHYEIANHNDSVIIDAFVVNEDELGDFYARMEKNKEKCKNGADQADFLKSVLKFQNYQIGVKTPGNFNTWDGNVDVAKMNYTYTNKDEQDLTLKGATAAEKEAYKQATYQVRDYVQKTGSYWTKLAKNSIIEGFANVIKGTEDTKEGYKKLILGTSEDKDAPCNNLGKARQVIDNEIIENVINNSYHISELQKTGVSQQLLLENIMNYPMEAIQFSDDLTPVLGSPYLSKKSSNPDDILKTRNEIFQSNNYDSIPKKYRDLYYEMDHDFYHGRFSSVAHKIIEKADKDGSLGLFNEKGHLTEKGKLVVPLISDDVSKFLIIKSLAPNVKIENKKGELEYDYAALRKVGLLSINGGKGISASSPEEEAKKVLNLLKEGISEITDKDKNILSENIKDRFKDVSTNALKMAYVILDKTESGLNWRTDATKDTMEIDNIRNGTDAIAKEWEEKGIPVWEAFVKGIRKENPNSLIITEMTDLHEPELFGPGSERFLNDLDATTKFVQHTGATTVSNYNVLYGSLQRMFLRDFQTGENGEGWDDYKKQLNKIEEAMTGKNDWGGKNVGFLYNLPADGVKHSHNFIGNHDKPRLMHNLVLDMGVFYNHNDAKETIKELTKIYAPNVETKTGVKPDTKAIAMAKAVGESLIPMVNDESIGIADKQKTKEALMGALQDLVSGEYKGKKFNSENFGVVSLDTAIRDVITQAQHSHGLVLDVDKDKSNDKFKKLTNKSFELMTREARQKSNVMDTFLMAMPGDPTFYMGDQLVESGYETACKNINVKNRNILHWEWLEDKDKEFVKKFHDEKKEIWNIRRDKELSALSNGDTAYLSPVANWGGDYENKQVSAFFRYNDESNVIVLAHNKNVEMKKHIIKDPLKMSLEERETINGTDIALNLNQKTPSIEKIDITPEYSDATKNVIRKGLAGGLPEKTMFKDAMDKTSAIVYGVCKEAEKYVIKQFDNEETYRKYIEKPTEGVAKAIDLKKNVMVLKKVAFRGRPNSNHIKIQAYLNSKTYLNEKEKYATLKNA